MKHTCTNGVDFARTCSRLTRVHDWLTNQLSALLVLLAMIRAFPPNEGVFSALWHHMHKVYTWTWSNSVCGWILLCHILSQSHWLLLLKRRARSSVTSRPVLRSTQLCTTRASVCVLLWLFSTYDNSEACVKLRKIFTNFFLCEYQLRKIRCVSQTYAFFVRK